jgi:hypothetical protein
MLSVGEMYMPIATLEPEVKAPTKQEIERLKSEMPELNPRSQTMRLEIGAKLLNGNGGSRSTLPVSSDSELEKLNENELKSAILSAWKKHQRLAGKEMRPMLFWLRLNLRAQGSRNDLHDKDRGFGAWVEKNLDVARSTAARWADEYAKEKKLTQKDLTSTQTGRSCVNPGFYVKPLAKRSKGITLWVKEPLHKQYKQALENIKEHFKITDNGEAVVKGLFYAAKIIAARSRAGNRRRKTVTAR